MICPRCKTENPQEAKYCVECGKKMKNESIIDKNNKKKKNKTTFRRCVYLTNGLLIVLFFYFIICFKASSTEIITYVYDDHKEYVASTSDPFELFTLGHGFSKKTSNIALYDSKEEYRKSISLYFMICSGALLLGGIIKQSI